MDRGKTRALRGPWVPREASLSSQHSIKDGCFSPQASQCAGIGPSPPREGGRGCVPILSWNREGKRGLIPLSSPTPGRGCRFLFPHGHGGEEGEFGPSPLTDTEEGKGGVSPSSLTEPEMEISASYSPHRHREGLSVPFTSQTVGGSVSLCPHRPRGWGGGLGVPLPSRTPRGSRRPSPLPPPRAVPRRVPSPGSS